MSSFSQDERLLRLRRLEGDFPCDRSARFFRMVFIALGWVFLPGVAMLGIGNALQQRNFASSTALLLLGCFGLWCGYVAWQQRGHRYVISNRHIASIGRRTLWTLDL